MIQEGTQAKNRRLTGTVVSDRMQKTRIVAVTRLKKHPKYLKYYKKTTRFKAHDEKNEYKTGDTVVVGETRPLSREKRWRIIGKSEALNSTIGSEAKIHKKDEFLPSEPIGETKLSQSETNSKSE